MSPAAKPKRKPVTDKVLDEYVELIAAGVAKGDAATMLGVSYRTLADRARKNPDLKARIDLAWYEGAEDLIEEARRRGVDGWEEPVYQRGELVGYVRKYDSNLLMFSIKGRRPEYKENPKIDLTQINAVKFEDRSVSIAEGWKVLVDAGINPAEIAAADGRQPARAELPVVAGLLAEPPDVQR